MHRLSLSSKVFHVLIVLFEKDLRYMVVSQLGIAYFTTSILLDDLVYLVVHIRRTTEGFKLTKPCVILKQSTMSRYSCQGQ
jgi:hypothetical protein